jgi:hypothetical protein
MIRGERQAQRDDDGGDDDDDMAWQQLPAPSKAARPPCWTRQEIPVQLDVSLNCFSCLYTGTSDAKPRAIYTGALEVNDTSREE